MKYIAMITYVNWTSFGRTLFKGLSVDYIGNNNSGIKTDNPNNMYDGFISCKEADIEKALHIINDCISKYKGFFRILPEYKPALMANDIINNISVKMNIGEFLNEIIKAGNENKTVTLYDFLRQYE